MAQSYNSPFTGDLIVPTDVSYNSIQISANSQLIWPDAGPISQSVSTTSYYYARIIDISALSAGLALSLPAANQGSLGSDILFRNVGALPITIRDFFGNNAFILTAGSSEWYYLTANQTPDGFWRHITFGAGVSSSNAAELAGGGLTVDVNARLGIGFPVSQSSASPALSEASRGRTYVWTGGSGTYNLPVPTIDAWTILVRNNGTGQLTLQPPNAGYNIDNVQSVQLLPGESTFIVYHASAQAFFTIGRNRLSNFYFSSSVWDISSTGGTLDLTQYATIIQRYRASSIGQPVTVDLPPSTNTYYVINGTNFPITFQIPGTPQGNTVTIAALQQSSIVADGTNLYAINTIAYGSLTLADSTRTAPALKIATQQTGFWAQLNEAGITVDGGTAYVAVNANQVILEGDVIATLDGGYVV